MEHNSYSCARSYSYIPGLQSAHTIHYNVYPHPEGAVIEVHYEGKGHDCREACLCRGLSVRSASYFACYLCENSVEPGCWFALLQEYGVPTQLLDPSDGLIYCPV